jgi:Tetracyclin repressor-like, C-terminal domain
MANPVVMRLFAWSGLENSAGTAAARRAEIDRKVTAMTKAEKAANANYLFSPRFRLTAIVTLATAWSSANPFGGILDPDAEGNAGALRDSIAQAVRLISGATAPHKPARRRRAPTKHHKARR